MKAKKLTLRRVILAVIAGVALWASFSPLSLWFLAIVGFALFARILRNATLPASFFYGLCVGLGFFLPLFYWARIASSSVIAWVALALLESVFIALVGFVWQLLSRSSLWGRPWLFPFAAAVVWIACEQLRSLIPFGGMPWGLLGFGQVNSPLVHLAPLGSTQLVGGAVVTCGVFVGQGVFRRQRFFVRLYSAVAVCVLLFAPLAIPLGTAPSTGTIRLAYAQGIVARPDEEVDGSRALLVTKNLATEVKNLEDKDFDVLVLPESTSDRDIRVDSASRKLISDIEDSAGSHPILLGTQEYIDDYRFNDYVLVSDGEVQARYSKQHPAPFGEYLPWRSFLIPLIEQASQISVDMRAGDKPAVLDVPLSRGEGDGVSSVRVAVPICFEVGDSTVLSQAIGEGASLIVVPTNNASFGDTAESRQQFDMTRFRAVEYGRDAVQISTVGVSGAIRSDGSVIEATEPWTAASSIVTLSLYENTTWAARLYPLIVWGVFCAGGFIVLWALVEYPYRRRLSADVKRKGQA
ncbi:MAG: apolipoprotein N-acyltransferase [Actinomycetaceae bacterium]|nr:apolipoprotein N-acyltransferase [Actinomycetaceae bacterium]